MSAGGTASDGLRRRAARLLALIRDGRARSELFTRLRFGAQVHQDISLSFHDRYPRLFTAARALLADRPAPRILSYGCAAGEEVTSLRGYFPDAMLVGAENSGIAASLVSKFDTVTPTRRIPVSSG